MWDAPCDIRIRARGAVCSVERTSFEEDCLSRGVGRGCVCQRIQQTPPRCRNVACANSTFACGRGATADSRGPVGDTSVRRARARAWSEGSGVLPVGAFGKVPGFTDPRAQIRAPAAWSGCGPMTVIASEVTLYICETPLTHFWSQQPHLNVHSPLRLPSRAPPTLPPDDAHRLDWDSIALDLCLLIQKWCILNLICASALSLLALVPALLPRFLLWAHRRHSTPL